MITFTLSGVFAFFDATCLAVMAQLGEINVAAPTPVPPVFLCPRHGGAVETLSINADIARQRLQGICNIFFRANIVGEKNHALAIF